MGVWVGRERVGDALSRRLELDVGGVCHCSGRSVGR